MQKQALYIFWLVIFAEKEKTQKIDYQATYTDDYEF